MKTIFFFGVLFIVNIGYGFDQTHNTFTEILKKYVNESGMVNYGELKKNRGAIDSYIKTMGAVSSEEFNGWDKYTRLAFLINLYNAETLQLIIDNYPVKSIKSIGSLLKSAWKTNVVILFGSPTTLDHVEHGILRKKYSEPRIHFALVCAAMSCPPLRNEAYISAKLDEQLNDQAKLFLAQKSKNRIEGKTLVLSPIFDWFEEDFTADGKSLAEYVNPYMPGDTTAKKVKFTKYDWSLNKQ